MVRLLRSAYDVLICLESGLPISVSSLHQCISPGYSGFPLEGPRRKFSPTCIINVIGEHGFNSAQIGPVAVAGKLYAIGQSAFQIVSERKGGVRIASAKQPANDQLGIGAECGPCPNVASGRGRGLGVLHVVILGVNEAPDFIHLDPLAGQIAQRLVLIGRAGMTGFNK